MSDDTLPIVFKSPMRISFGLVAIGLFMVAVGVLKLTVDTGSETIGPIEVSGATLGWILLLAGVAIAFAAMVSVASGCPTLTLAEGGVSYRTCFGGSVDIAWSDIRDATVTAIITPGPGRRSQMPLLRIAGHGGARIEATNFGNPKDIADTVQRIASHMRGAAPPAT